MTATTPDRPGPGPAPALRGANAAKAVLAAAVLGGATYVATTGVPAWEQEVFTWLHDMPRAVDYALWLPMQAGSAWAPPSPP